MKLMITKPTVLKARPLLSSDLRNDEKESVSPGTVFELESYTADRNKHWKVVFKTAYKGWKTWFIFQEHGEITGNPSSLPISKLLKVPYKSQLDNRRNPTGSCNVTSIAMCLSYFGIKSSGGGQLEDELYNYMERRGLRRHSPQDLARVVRDYGRKDDFTVWGTIERCKQHINNGFPCVIHGYFTSFGHIIVLVGYDQYGFIVHDPYGEWFSTGYRNDLSGESLHYSYNLIQQTCMADGQFWVNYIS